jgi:quinol monooxygenase YgiN
MLAVVVTLTSHPDKIGEMIAALENNASHSRHEPECLKWEWSQHIDDPSRFAIYELYTGRDAFAAHKASDHFAAWVEASAPCIREKVAGQYEVKGADPRPVTCDP